MPTTTCEARTPPPATASGLLALVEPFGPVVEGGALVFDTDPSAALEPALRVLHTGLRALLSGRRWYGCDGDSGRVVELQSVALVPPGTTLLAVESDACWDRIHPDARIDLPHLFAQRG